MLDLLLNASARVLALGLLAAAAAWFLRRRPADLRHAIWLTTLGAMLLLPVCMLLLPPLPLLPAPQAIDFALDLPQAAPAAAITTAPVRPAVSTIDWTRIPELLYLALAAAALFRLALSLRKTRSLIAEATPIDHPFLAEEAARQGLPAPLPALLESPSTRVPFTAGWRAPVLLLPADWPTWDDFRLRSVLAHELAHVRRSDWATAILAAANRAIFWFHPQAWWIERRLAALAEEACDAAAIAATNDPEAYAQVVLHFAGTLPTHPHLPATAMARNSKVGTRIERILEGHPMLTQTLTPGRWFSLTLLTIPILYAAAALQQQDPLPAPPPPVQSRKGAAMPAVNTTAPQAQSLEARVAANPEDLDARSQLLSYYLTQKLTDAYAKQLLWLVEKHPESEIHDSYAGFVSRDPSILRDPSAHDKLDTLWRRKAAENPANPAVLRHAAHFIFDTDPATSMEFLKSARLVAPGDPLIAKALQQQYTILLLTQFGGRNTPSWQSYTEVATRDLKASSDQVLVGSVGRNLASFQARPRPGATEVENESTRQNGVRIHELGINLLDRAIALDPANQEWKDARQSALAPQPAPDPSAPRRINVGLELQKAQLVSAPQPEYPPLARQARIAGTVRFSVVIGADGYVTKSKVISGHPLLVQAAMAALQKYVYKPAIHNGVPVEITTQVEIPFVLPQ